MKKSERYKNIEKEVRRVLDWFFIPLIDWVLIPLIVLFIVLIEWVWREVKRGVDRA
jgi:ABC-type uncharacterized transport system involved in gliding motility auxiliary subunit